MICISEIKKEFLTIVGCRQPYNTDYAILDSENLKSDSGYFITDNPLAKIEFLKGSQDFIDISDSEFNEYLTNLKMSSITDVLSQVFSSSDYMNKAILHEKGASSNVLPANFVGYKLTRKCENIAVHISSGLFRFVGTDNLDILFIDEIGNIQTQNVVIDKNNLTASFAFKMCSNTAWIGYVSKPALVPYDTINVLNDLLTVEPVSITDYDTESIHGNEVSLPTGIGISLTVSFYKDFTKTAIDNKYLFSRAILLNSVIKFLQVYMASLRSSGNEQIASQLYKSVLIEINGIREDGLVNVKGLSSHLINEITSIKDELSKLNEVFNGDGYHVLTEI